MLSSSLKTHGHETRVLYSLGTLRSLNSAAEHELIEFSAQSDIIGISLLTIHFKQAVLITQIIKKAWRIPVIWGGIHPTIAVEECLKHADMVCVGEGEEAVVELAARMSGSLDISTVRNICFSSKEGIKVNPVRPLVRELDSLALPDNDFENNFMLDNSRCVPIDKELLIKTWFNQTNVYKEGYPTFPSRGCPFGCAYCCNNKINSLYSGQVKVIRKRSTQNIIQELAEAKAKFPVKNMWFWDDNFFLYTDTEIEAFAREYKQKINLPLYIGGATPSTLSREKLNSLVDAGLVFLRMGIQTGSENTKKLYKRPFSNEVIARDIRLINEFKDKIPMPFYDIIVDNPWETQEDVIKTLMFLASLPVPFRLQMFSLRLFEGTELWEKARSDPQKSALLEKAYSDDFDSCNQVYFNKLFDVLDRYARQGRKIPVWVMFLLTNKWFRMTGISFLIYVFLSKNFNVAEICNAVIARLRKA